MALGMQYLLVEWFRADAGQPRMNQITAAIAGALTAPRDHDDVWLVLILAVPTDQVVYGLFAASSAESLLSVCEQAGIPPQRVSTDVHPVLHHALT